MIIYACEMGESLAALFLAGIVPGILSGGGLMPSVHSMADRRDLPARTKRVSWGQRGRSSLRAVWPLLSPGVILAGVFTPTEAAGVAVGYSILIVFFVLRTLKLSDLPDSLIRAGLTSAVVLLLVGAAMAYKTVAALAHTPVALADLMLSLSQNPLILLFLIKVLLFIVGIFLDAGPAIIIIGPILGPIFVALGVDSVHSAIVMAVNLTVGPLTPPMGLVLFVNSVVSGLRVETIAKATLPFLTIEVLVIILITYFPAICLTIPRFLGLVN